VETLSREKRGFPQQHLPPSVFWNLVKEQCKPQERLHAPFIRDRTPKDSQDPRERRDLTNISQSLAAQINRTAWILQELLNPGLGLPADRLLLQVEKDHNSTAQNVTSNLAQDYILATRRSQNLSTFAVFSLIMAFIMALILVAGICAQVALKEEDTLEKNPLPIIKMTSIIDPEDLTSDVLPLVRTDPQGNGIVGENP
jgi:hypothetical protein